MFDVLTKESFDYKAKYLNEKKLTNIYFIEENQYSSFSMSSSKTLTQNKCSKELSSFLLLFIIFVLRLPEKINVH